MERHRRTPHHEEFQVSKLSRSPQVCKPRRRACRGAGAPPRHLPCLGESRDHDLDAQDQWSDRKRFHSGPKNRPAPHTLNPPLRTNPPTRPPPPTSPPPRIL